MKKILDTIKLKWAEYLLEIIVIVLSIFGGLELEKWNAQREERIKEVEILRSFQNLFSKELKEFDRSLEFYREGKSSIKIILNHLENDRTYHDSLKYHFFTSTRTWGTSDLGNSSFDSFKSIGADIISNKEIRDEISFVYDFYDDWIEKFEADYIEFLLNASETLFNTRFVDFWNGDYNDPTFVGEMVPIDFEKLKTDQEYLYFLRTQRNHIGWMIEKPIEATKPRIKKLLLAIEMEIERLEN